MGPGVRLRGGPGVRLRDPLPDKGKSAKMRRLDPRELVQTPEQIAELRLKMEADAVERNSRKLARLKSIKARIRNLLMADESLLNELEDCLDYHLPRE